VYSKQLLLLLAFISGAFAQQREVGFLGGGGFLNGLTVQGAAAPVTAGFSPGPIAGFLVGQDLYSHWSGEIRYFFEVRDARLRSNTTQTGFSGQAHALHYDIVFHPRPRQNRVRTYFAVGGGIKVFRGTGAETAYRPLMQYAYLTQTQEMKAMLTVGGGLKFRLRGRMIGRIDLRDQVTRFPRKIITPAPGMTLQGWLHDFVPTVGVSWTF
jgi:hypothetical protein